MVASEGEPLFEICEVCFWQYDAVAHDRPDEIVGANHNISLNEAKRNYERYGVCKIKKGYRNMTRPPMAEEYEP